MEQSQTQQLSSKVEEYARSALLKKAGHSTKLSKLEGKVLLKLQGKNPDVTQQQVSDLLKQLTASNRSFKISSGRISYLQSQTPDQAPPAVHAPTIAVAGHGAVGEHKHKKQRLSNSRKPAAVAAAAAGAAEQPAVAAGIKTESAVQQQQEQQKLQRHKSKQPPLVPKAEPVSPQRQQQQQQQKEDKQQQQQTEDKQQQQQQKLPKEDKKQQQQKEDSKQQQQQQQQPKEDERQQQQQQQKDNGEQQKEDKRQQQQQQHEKVDSKKQPSLLQAAAAGGRHTSLLAAAAARAEAAAAAAAAAAAKPEEAAAAAAAREVAAKFGANSSKQAATAEPQQQQPKQQRTRKAAAAAADGMPKQQRKRKATNQSVDGAAAAADAAADAGGDAEPNHRGRRKSTEGTWREDYNRHDLKHGPYSEDEAAEVQAYMSEFAKARGLPDQPGTCGWLLDLKAHGITRNQLTESIFKPCLPHRACKSVWQYVTRVYPPFKWGPWSADEDAQLRSLQSSKGNKWKEIGLVLGRHSESVADRWTNLNAGNERKKGQWSKDEEERLAELVKSYKAASQGLEVPRTISKTMLPSEGDKPRALATVRLDDIDWSWVSQQMGNRSTKQCSDKWFSCLAPTMVESGEWAEGDDGKLVLALQAALQAGPEWEVDWDKLVPGRTMEQCKRRWRVILKHLPLQLRNNLKEAVEVAARRINRHLAGEQHNQQQQDAAGGGQAGEEGQQQKKGRKRKQQQQQDGEQGAEAAGEDGDGAAADKQEAKRRGAEKTTKTRRTK